MKLRAIVITVFVAALAPAAAAAQSLSASIRHFDEGNRRYDAGDYEGAIRSYQRAREQGYESGAALFNMGNAYYRLDALGEAIRYYEKARRYIPDSPVLEHNLAIARERTQDRFSRLPEPVWKPVWRRLVSLFGPGGLFVLGLVSYTAAVVAVALRIRSGRTSWRRRAAVVGAAAAICFVALSFAAAYDQSRASRAVVLVDEVTLLDGPGGARSDLRIHEGLVVDVASGRGEWTEVRLPNGARGWLRSSDLGPI